MTEELNHIIRCGDSLTLIEDIPDKSIDLLVTSPPYWAKRIYNNETEIGTEPSVELYINNLVYFFKSMERKLKDSCNIFINLGDTYFVSAPPKLSITAIVKYLKGISGRKLLEHFPNLRNELWKGELWNHSYYVETIGSVSEENIKRYIERQSKSY